MGKGDKFREVDRDKFNENYDNIFKPKEEKKDEKTNICSKGNKPKRKDI